jgi:hypothetical protein
VSETEETEYEFVGGLLKASAQHLTQTPHHRSKTSSSETSSLIQSASQKIQASQAQTKQPSRSSDSGYATYKDGQPVEELDVKTTEEILEEERNRFR